MKRQDESEQADSRPIADTEAEPTPTPIHRVRRTRTRPKHNFDDYWKVQRSKTDEFFEQYDAAEMAADAELSNAQQQELSQYETREAAADKAQQIMVRLIEGQEASRLQFSQIVGSQRIPLYGACGESAKRKCMLDEFDGDTRKITSEGYVLPVTLIVVLSNSCTCSCTLPTSFCFNVWMFGK